jgi:hypothetical protein
LTNVIIADKEIEKNLHSRKDLLRKALSRLSFSLVSSSWPKNIKFINRKTLCLIINLLNEILIIADKIYKLTCNLIVDEIEKSVFLFPCVK